MRGRLLILAAASLLGAHADTNIDPAHSRSGSDFIGEIDWRLSDVSGAEITQYFCSGFIYGSSVGWINLGSGQPANGVAYANNSAVDFGVNVSPAGQLTGFAYGANIGWINFAPTGNARVDWTTGKLSGSAWSANAGWIPLASTADYLRIDSLAQLPDTDGDGLPDAWEIQMAGSLNVLSADADTDHDGQTDLQEYLAGTNPLDPTDFLGPLHLTVTQEGNDLTFPTKRDYVYRIEQHPPFGSGLWAPALAAPLTGTGSEQKIHLPPNSSQLFFYRLAAYPPLTRLN